MNKDIHLPDSIFTSSRKDKETHPTWPHFIFETVTQKNGAGRGGGGGGREHFLVKGIKMYLNSFAIWFVILEAHEEVERMLDNIGNACKILPNQTEFPLWTFATTPSIHHISNCDHRRCKNTEPFLAPASNPPGPWTPHGVKFVCISPPGNQVINFSFIYHELLPKRIAFIGKGETSTAERQQRRSRMW